MKNSKEYKYAKSIAIEKACGATPMSDIFEAGFDFAMSQPKHIFDGIAQVGDVRRFEGGLVDVVHDTDCILCTNCVLREIQSGIDCNYLTGCETNNVKYLKR